MTHPFSLAPRLFEEMPLDVAAIIRDEAQLRRARDIIETELEQSTLRLRQIRREQSWWTVLVHPDARDKRYQDRNQTEQYRSQLLTLLRTVKALQKRLAPSATLRGAIAHRLGEVEPRYRQGLRASRYHEHWRRHHTLVRDRLNVLLKKLRHALGLVGIDVEEGHRKHSRDVLFALEASGTAAIELETFVGELNGVSEAHRSLVLETPFHEVQLPKLVHWHCAHWISELAHLSPTETQPRMEAHCIDCEHDRLAMLATVDTLFRDAASLHSSIAEHHLSDALEGMIIHAERYWIDDRELRTVIDEIESRQSEAERARWAQEISRPREAQATP